MTPHPQLERTERKPRIFIPMIEVGGCHKSIALSIRDSIERLQPGRFDIRVVDFMSACGARMSDRSIKASWNAALAQPGITNLLNKWMDDASLLMRSNAISQILYPAFVQKGMAYIRDEKPDLIVATHFFCTSVAVLARERYGLDCRIVSHVSDPFRAHALWVNPLVDELVVCSEQARDYLAMLGQNPETMRIVPFPINGRFFEPAARSREAILEDLGLDPRRITILASSGGEGIGSTDRYVRDLYFSDLPINLIAICGRNERLLREMRLLHARPSGVRFAPLGFVTNMNELTDVADAAVVKAGPSTLFELLGKGCPVYVTHVAAQVEQGNLDFVVQNGLGWDVRDSDAWAEQLARLRDPACLEPVRARILRNEYIRSLPGASMQLAQALLAGMTLPRSTRRQKLRRQLAHAPVADRMRRQARKQRRRVSRKRSLEKGKRT